MNEKNTELHRFKRNIEQIVEHKERVVKYIYDKKIECKKYFPEKAYQKIRTLFESEISKENFLNYFNVAYEATTANKLREFQYRILQSILTTNITLKAWKMNDDKCTFCKREPETMKHLLLQCKYSKIICDHIKEFTQLNTDITITFSDAEIILGISDSDDLKIYNLVNMTVKQYIYACRCNQVIPSPSAAIEKNCINKETEYKIALKNNRIDQFNDKWQMLRSISIVR